MNAGLTQHPSVSTNAIAAHLIQVAKAPDNKKFERQVRMQGRTLLQQMSYKSLPHLFTEEEIFQLLCRRRNQRQRQPQATTSSSTWNL